jgi:DNA-binding MarR family transcriptional regulator
MAKDIEEARATLPWFLGGVMAQRTVQTEEQQSQYGLRILNAIRQIIRAADLDSRQLAASHQITAPQLVSLMAIAEQERTTAVAVARRVHLGPSTLVGVLDRLEAKGLLTRERDSEDRRQVWLRATRAGRTLVARTPFPLQHAVARAFGQMNKAERAQVARCLERLVELMAVAELDVGPMLEIVGVQAHAEDLQN